MIKAIRLTSLSICLALTATAFAADTARLGNWGIETRHLSESIAAGDDFFQFVNEGWLQAATMPAGFSRFGSFAELALEAEERVEAIIADAAASQPEAASAEGQIANLHASYMDADRIETLGLAPIEKTLHELLALESHEGVARWMGKQGTGALIAVRIAQDAGNPERYLVHLGQSGLGLPNRDYYDREDEPFPAHREAYRSYIAATFERAGIDRAEQRAADVLALETAVAANHFTRVEQRDRQANYNLIERGELEKLAPGFPWEALLSAREVNDVAELVLTNDRAVIASAELFAEFPVEHWASWHAFHWINNHATLLPEAFAQAHFEFFQRRLGGVEERRPRDRRAINLVSNRLGELVGQVYVQRHFPPEHRAQMETLVEYLRRAFAERLAVLDWMDDETRAEAQRKLDAFLPKIGYPDRWRDYSDVSIAADDLVGNLDRLTAWFRADSLARLDEPVREWEWFMTPQTVNAYYSSTRNEIVFPAAILQPPFFDPNADAAVNFGAIGGVIGHEMGHGFDDQGSRSDADGVLRNWWTDHSRAEFERRTSVLVAQYDAFEPLPGMNINGQLALGENIGDLGGLSIAHHAYQLYLADHHDGQAPVLDGLTGDQRFFMAWAQVWRTIETEESLRARLITGPHSPARYRVNGVVRNIDAWYEAFGVQPEHALYVPAEERVNIW
ncbi:MAG: M13 family peptidase [Wenzhouxiangella sp.]|nr:MAG: M13 family peptidase [Wenzhouxiangella sp.]